MCIRDRYCAVLARSRSSSVGSVSLSFFLPAPRRKPQSSTATAPTTRALAAVTQYPTMAMTASSTHAIPSAKMSRKRVSMMSSRPTACGRHKLRAARARRLLEKPQRDALREQRLKREIAHEDTLVDVVVARRHLVVALDEVRSEVVRHDLGIGGAEPVGVGEAHRVTVGQFGLGYVTLQDGADGVRKSCGIRRRVAADHADPLQVPLRLDAGQGGAHLGLDLVLVVTRQHPAVDAQLHPGGVDVHGDAVGLHDSRREGEAVQRLDHVGELGVARGEFDEGAARGGGVAQAGAQVEVAHQELDELPGRLVDDDRQLVRRERLDDLRRGEHGVAAAQRHRGVPGFAVHDETELRRALLAALEQVHAATGRLDEVAAALDGVEAEWDLEWIGVIRGNASPYPTALSEAIRTVLQRHVPEAELANSHSVGFTDSNWFRAAYPEILAYNFAPHIVESYDEVTTRYHNVDERILVRDLAFQALFAERVALELLK